MFVCYVWIQRAEHRDEWTDFDMGGLSGSIWERGSACAVDWETRSLSTGLHSQVTNGALSARNDLLINQRSLWRFGPDWLHHEKRPSDSTLNAKPQSAQPFLLVSIHCCGYCHLITSENWTTHSRLAFILRLLAHYDSKSIELSYTQINSTWQLLIWNLLLFWLCLLDFVRWYFTLSGPPISWQRK